MADLDQPPSEQMDNDAALPASPPLYPCHHCGYSNADSPSTCPECGQVTSRELAAARQRKPLDRRWLYIAVAVAPLFLLKVSFIVYSAAWSRVMTSYWVGVLFTACAFVVIGILAIWAPPKISYPPFEERKNRLKVFEPGIVFIFIFFAYFTVLVIVSYVSVLLLI